MPSAGYNTFVLVLIGAANLFAVFQLLARQGGDVELKAATATLRQATDSLQIVKKEANATAAESLQLFLALQNAKVEAAASQRSSTESSCESVLDKLDARFNAQRKARQELPGPQSPWEVEKTYYDKFEPEAVCFDEERFGGSVRYHALGDGPKFVCGVDFIAKKGKKEGCLVYSIGRDWEQQ